VDFGNVLTIGWFGDVFFVMSAQNSAIFADPISTIDVIARRQRLVAFRKALDLLLFFIGRWA
jgi:hypothetical protein